MLDTAFDTDVLVKCSAYRILQNVAQTIAGSVLVLGAAKYTVLSRLNAVPLRGDVRRAIEDAQAVLIQAIIIEPTSEESQFAAELEYTAQKNSVALDVGESQLVAVTVSRENCFLATGDKRAIQAIQKLLPIHPMLQSLAGRVICLEQILLRLLKVSDATKLRKTICQEAAIDKTATICFSCANSEAKAADWEAGLQSYISSLRTDAPDFLSKFDS